MDLGGLTLLNYVSLHWDKTKDENSTDTNMTHFPLEQTGSKIYP